MFRLKSSANHSRFMSARCMVNMSAAKRLNPLPPKFKQPNGTDEQPNGTDISSWVNTSDLDAVSFTLADAAAYRTKGASKAIPWF